MKKYKYASVIVIFLTILIVNSRRVSKKDFDLLVLLEYADIVEVCNNRLKAKQKNQNINFDNIKYNDKLYYNYNLDKHGSYICSDVKSIERIAEEYWRDYFKKNWKFVF